MGIAAALRVDGRPSEGALDRVRLTVGLLERRGYATTPEVLAEICLGGPVSVTQVMAAAGGYSGLSLAEGLLVSEGLRARAPAIAARAARHQADAARYLPATVRFARLLTALSPYVLCVALAGSMASGGFVESDDVDLNLVVEDGRRHLAYVALNALGFAHALRHRGKPVDAHTRRPLAPRVMTANLILERSQCFPLARRDQDMAYELLRSEPVVGADFLARVVDANPDLLSHFPQLARRPARLQSEPVRRLPAWLFPGLLERPARRLARAGWRYMQWTRRGRPEALARVAFVRETMRPYNLFPDL